MCSGETLSTLKFAARAKHIRCSAVRNEEFSGTVDSLLSEVKSLRQQLSQLSGHGFGAVPSMLLQAAPAKSPTNENDTTLGDAEEDEMQVLCSRKTGTTS